jgi:hypothetical protein
VSELLIGCGVSRVKKLVWQGRSEWAGLVTLDMNDAHGAEIVHDLADLPLPFGDGSFDEIHAYDVMEHVGQQGDWRFFFDQWSDFWRMLKPGGVFCGISPAPHSPWAWGDPGHTRIMSPECLIFLSQPQYAQVGRTPMTDYRLRYAADFDVVHAVFEGQQFHYVLQAVKPARGAIQAASPQASRSHASTSASTSPGERSSR